MISTVSSRARLAVLPQSLPVRAAPARLQAPAPQPPPARAEKKPTNFGAIAFFIGGLILIGALLIKLLTKKAPAPAPAPTPT